MDLSPLPVMLWWPKAVVSIKPDTHVFIGEVVTLRCEIQGGGDTRRSYTWYKNNNILYESEKSFTIWSAGNSDSGDYTCSEYYNRVESAVVSLTVSEKPQPTLSVNPQNPVYTGDTVTLTCELNQGIGWGFLWYKYNQQNLVTEQEHTNTLKRTAHNAGETVYQCVAGRNNPWANRYYDTEFSNKVRITARERPRPVLSVSSQSWITEGDSVTLNCKVTDSSTDWTFSWYRVVTYRYSTGQISNRAAMLSDSSRGSGGSYTLSPAALNHTGVYVCKGERGEPALHTQYSNRQTLWITGESPPVSLIINPSRNQHFTGESLTLSCEDQRHSTGWTVRRYTNSWVSDHSWCGSVTGSTCKFSPLYPSYTGVYWCESESGENSNPVNITVHVGNVILESPVHPVTEGHPLTLRCLYRNTKPSNLRADFYKDGSVLQTQTTGGMIIQKVSKSDEGFYHCKYTERGESLKSWVSVRGIPSKSTDGAVGLSVGLSLFFLILIVLLILMILLWYYRMKKEKQQKLNQTSEQNQNRSGAEDSQSGHTPPQAGTENVYASVDQADMSGTGEAAAESNEAIYSLVTNKQINRNNGADAHNICDVMYADLELKPVKKKKRVEENVSVGDETVYSELQQK